MQPVSAEFERIYRSRNYYSQTSLVVDANGNLLTEEGDRILFGGVAIRVADGNVGSGYGESMVNSIKTTRRVFKNNKPEVGCCTCGEIYVEMHMPKGTISRKAEIIPYMRLVSNEDGSASEWIRKGTFYIDTRENTHNDDNLDILTIHGYDAMMRAEQPYGEFFQEEEFAVGQTEWTKNGNTYTYTINSVVIPSTKDVSIEYIEEESVAFSSKVSYSVVSNRVRLTATSTTLPPTNFFGKIVLREKNTIGFPALDRDVVADIANKMDVEVDQRAFKTIYNPSTHRNEAQGASEQPYINQGYPIQYPAEYTMREVLGYIGAMYGGNWIMNDMNQLQFIPIWDLPEETYLLIDDLGYYITFGGVRIKLTNY